MVDLVCRAQTPRSTPDRLEKRKNSMPGPRLALTIRAQLATFLLRPRDRGDKWEKLPLPGLRAGRVISPTPPDNRKS